LVVASFSKYSTSSLAVALLPSGLTASDDHHSHLSLHEIDTLLDELVAYYPHLVQTQLVGFTEGLKPIKAIRIQRSKGKPFVFVNAAHHGNEKISTTVLLRWIIDLLKNQVNTGDLLDTFSLLIVPVVNPDGYGTNSRRNINGVDPNRDYPASLQSYDENSHSRSIQAMVRLVREHDVRYAVALHSGMEGILWPWGYKRLPTRDHQLFRSIAREVSSALGMNHYKQSYHDYPTRGEFIDFAYAEKNIIAFTFEISAAHEPALLEFSSVAKRALFGLQKFMSAFLSIEIGQGAGKVSESYSARQ
jgi:predicted deacylase